MSRMCGEIDRSSPKGLALRRLSVSNAAFVDQPVSSSMLLSAAVALSLFAAPETTQSGETAQAQPAAEAKPATRKVCVEVEVAGSRLPKRKCREEPVKVAPKTEAEQTAKAAPAA